MWCAPWLANSLRDWTASPFSMLLPRVIWHNDLYSSAVARKILRQPSFICVFAVQGENHLLKQFYITCNQIYHVMSSWTTSHVSQGLLCFSATSAIRLQGNQSFILWHGCQVKSTCIYIAQYYNIISHNLPQGALQSLQHSIQMWRNNKKSFNWGKVQET